MKARFWSAVALSTVAVLAPLHAQTPAPGQAPAAQVPVQTQTPAAAPVVPAPTAPGTLPATTAGISAPAPAPQPSLPAIRPTGNAATVNGNAIPEVAVYRALRQFPVAEHVQVRKEILSHLIDNSLIDQYLTLLKINVEAAEVDKLLGELKAEIAKATPPKDFVKELESMMLTEEEFKAEVASQMKWDKFVKQQTSDDNLKKLFESSPNVFDGSLVRARHILLDPKGDAKTKQQMTDALKKVKSDIEANAIATVAALPATTDAASKEQAKNRKVEELFAEVAKQSSVCSTAKMGGDLNYFPRVGVMVEPFSKAAYELPVYGMSDVVESEFGLHLILLTGKNPGKARPFEEVKEEVRALYAFRLREAVVTSMKPKAQIVYTPQAATGSTVTPASAVGR